MDINYNVTFGEVLAENYNYLKFIFLALIILATIGLNLFVIFVVALDKAMRNFVNFQFTSIALADIIVGAVAMPSLLISTIYRFWPLSRSSCVLWCICDFFGCNVSSLSLVMLSIHRLKCIKKPFLKASKSELKLQIVSTTLIWLVPFICWSISIIVIETDPNLNIYMERDQCYFMYTFAYVFTANTFAYFLPAATLIVTQILIYFALKQQANKILAVTANNKLKVSSNEVDLYETPTAGISPLENDVSENKTKLNLRPRKLTQNEKAFRSLLLVATSYLILWLPWITVWPIQAYCSCVPAWYYETTYWLQYLNSLANPVFLIIGHISFREKFVTLFKSIKSFKCR